MKKLTFTNELIFISIIITIISFFISWLKIFWMHSGYINNWEYILFVLQLLIYQFIHAWFSHILSNSIFLFIFWNQLEIILWRNRYILFFALNTIFVAICLLIFSKWITIGISWLNTAILGYLVINIKKINKNEYIWGIILIIMNILAWLDANISLTWHLSWAIFGILFYYIYNAILKVKYK